ncbi:MAG TPA: hypothetical protein VFI54_07885 [Solirubrobacteraceae bacterium]|nr:hypothetical protein [Solirubrobacteraceae bacterium]
MSIAVKRTQRERFSVAARRSILGAVIALFIDSYDIYPDRRRVPTTAT